VAANRPAPELQSSAWFILWLAVIGLLTATAIRGRFRGAVVRLVRFHRMELAQVGVLLAFALLLRAFDPARFPAPVQTDEADYAISALGVPAHGINFFASGYFGVPTLWIAVLSAFERVFSDPIVAGRVLSAITGAAAIPLLYGFLREGFDRRVATGGALFLALSFAHLQFSRMALPNATDTTIAVAAWWCCLRALRTNARGDWVLLGLALGLGAFGWISARLVLIEVALTLSWALLAGRIHFRQLALGAVLTTLTATAVVLPLATWWIGHPTEFKGRLNEVGITSRPGESPSWLETQRDAGRSYPDIFATQSIDSIRAVFGGPEATQFLASDRGMFDLVATALIVLGAIVARLRIRDPAYFLPLASVALGIIFGGILVIPAASSARLIAVIPGACALAAIGARYLIDAVPRPTRFATVPAICALAAMPGLLHYTTHQGAYQRWQGADPLPGFANVVALSHAGDTIVWVTPPGDPPPFPPKLNLLLRETGVVMLTKDDTILQKRPPLTETRVTRRVVLLIPPGGSASEYCAAARLLEPSIELGPALPVDAYQAAQQDCIHTTDVAQ
jgi:4-amino-4-deoxy-L-arabinose transferase-like glycosyltransferase